MSSILDNPLVLLICLALIAFGCVYAWAQVGPEIIAALDYAFNPAPAAPVTAPLPLSKHARTSHAFQHWNAESIQNHMLDGKCTPNEYYCGDITVRWCEIKPGLSIGLFIGKTVQQIITGFAASTGYWSGRCP